MTSAWVQKSEVGPAQGIKLDPRPFSEAGTLDGISSIIRRGEKTTQRKDKEVCLFLGLLEGEKCPMRNKNINSVPLTQTNSSSR